MDLEAIDVYDLPKANLEKFSGLIVSDRVDQEFLNKQSNIVREFLEDGKVVVFSGGLFHQWLPGGHTFVPHEAGVSKETQLSISPHPIFAGLTGEDLGSEFAYGHHPTPAEAEVIVSLTDGGAAVYVDRFSTRGVILVHAGHSLLGYGADKGAARRIVPQLLTWMTQEVASRNG
jgi:hypothetical protein